MTKRKVPNVVRGGKAIPLKGKTNYYYMQGRKHSSGGIDIGENPRTGLEVEDGEVMHITDKEIKVFSSVPFLNGKSPAQKVMGGENPTKVFNQQESYKDKKGLNDDGTKKNNRRKAQMGFWDDLDKAADIAEKGLGIANLGTSTATLVAPNPYTAAASYITGLGGAALDLYQGTRAAIKGDWTNVIKNAADIGMSLIGLRALRNANKLRQLDKTLNASGATRQYVTKTVGRGKGKRKVTSTKEADSALTNEAIGFTTIPVGTAMSLVDIDSKNKKRMGGLNRKQDYGSKSKPYPKVKAGDFAGGGRSYPIPTKADAVDALRLAGLHGRSDVKAKVYSKYPELRKKSKAGGLYSVTVGGRTKLRMFPSTGESAARSAAVRAKKVTGGPKGINPDLVEEEDNYEYTVKDYIRDNKENLILDGIGLTSNLAGSIIANRATNYAINKMVAPVKPTAPVNKRAAKLKTRININPQLAKMAESVASYERNVDNNTASSQVALSRKQRARANTILMANELYADKENRETSLINQDRLNQQSVANANVDSYNKYLDKVNDYENARVAFENQRIARKADNTISLINNINAGIQDVVGKTVKRKSENQTISAMAFANPNLPIEVLYAQGLVNKRTYDAYKKAYRNKKKDKKD